MPVDLGREAVTSILAICELASTLNGLMSEGSHAFWLHVDSDVLAHIEQRLEDQVNAIQDEIDNPQ